MNLILFCLLLGLPSTNARRIHRVDLIEINHVCRRDQSQFTQIIIWDWSPTLNQYVVVAWQNSPPEPIISRAGGSYQFRWRLTDQIVRADSYRETWTLNDPELDNRKVWPVERRRQLW
ncbi:MAG: hypothetical protein CMK32_09550 [Porticoccaceae bacterium]|nr:hypothetical protein [Porticoccaceae bacterium]